MTRRASIRTRCRPRERPRKATRSTPAAASTSRSRTERIGSPSTLTVIVEFVVGEDGSESKRSFRELSIRSNQVANHLRSLGVRRGERILLMLGNELPLWETMLAAFKLGAVVIPATTLLVHDDLVDRFERGGVNFSHVSGGRLPHPDIPRF